MAGFRVRSAPDPVRIVPHPSVMLLVEVGGRSVVRDADGRRRRWGSHVAGLGFGAGGSFAVRADDVECVEVRLSPTVARSVLGVSPAELEGIAVPLDDVVGRELARLGERLGELATWEERFAATDAWLAGRRTGHGAPDPEVAWAWRRIVASEGAVRVDELAAEVGWSRKRLWTRFGAQLGAAPKRAATLVRFDRAAHRIVAGLEPGRAAADGGYADQSHLHREVLGFAGVTPARLAAEPFLAVDDVAWPARRR
ncbi:AraC family transcriptional regulator [Luteimicrobium album]|uniref:AraC family transcriptional regulator n=2 Tax=Luteimicrobium album TaxID=1054550 RepID=A0ABQ6HZX3_9MICO|nr:AraC family transcriptional regulator [Luteimicrobium album]